MNRPENILLIHLYSNGDSLYATTVARQIKEDHPGCHLTWAIAGYCRNIIANNPYIDEAMVVPDINQNNWEQHWGKFQQQVKDLKNEGRVDKVFFTQLIAGNLANYDHCIRSGIFRGYPGAITVPIHPVLRLTGEEKTR